MSTAAIDVSDSGPTSDGATFDPSAVDKQTLDVFGEKLSNLIAATETLATSMKSTEKAQPVPEKPTLESLQARLQQEETASKQRAAARLDLTALPSDDNMTIFTECDELMVSGDVESALLGAEAAARGYADKAARLAALTALKMPLDDAMAKIAAAGVALRPDFIEFVEMCAVKRVRLCCLSRGLKPVLRAMLREEGLGHVEVLAHEMAVERADGNTWSVCLRDDSETGHDKAESMRRALQGGARGSKRGSIVLVGQLACDYAPVKAGMVDCLYAPAGSKLAEAARAAGVKHRDFDGWQALQKCLLGM